MIKAHVQIPDELYKRAKALAEAKEWSLAEVFRRGLEYMTSVSCVEAMGERWELPVLSAEQFSDEFDELDLRDLVEEDSMRRD